VIVHAWRIVEHPFVNHAFTGEGARVAGGRWNTPGKPMVYTAASASLAMLEMLVHLGRNELLREYVLFELTFDDALMTGVDPTILPANWREYPVPHAVQQIGDSWIAQTASAVLRVPSVVVPMEWNYLLNPLHEDFDAINIGPAQSLRFDPRLK